MTQDGRQSVRAQHISTLASPTHLGAGSACKTISSAWPCAWHACVGHQQRSWVAGAGGGAITQKQTAAAAADAANSRGEAFSPAHACLLDWVMVDRELSQGLCVAAGV
jgi:hypothetical protein